ncbi:MAG TPA: arginase family protein [Thermoanaerobaculia bacterium]
MKLALLDWPSNLGLRPSGVETLPSALRAAGLLDRLQARDAGSMAPSAAYDATRSSETGLLNGPALRKSVERLAAAIGEVMARGEVPLVLAGDCSVVLAGLLGARKAHGGRVGLLFIDGHADVDLPADSPTGEAADMDLALATGRGPSLLTAFGDETPLVRDEDVAAVGARDEQSLQHTAITQFDLAAIRARGIAAIAAGALEVVQRAPRFWCHIDADVLDDAVMPAVDYRQPDGLTPEELTALLREAAQSGRMAGLSLAIYNPALDPAGEGARLLVDVLVGALQG